MIHDFIVVDDDGEIIPKRKTWMAQVVQRAKQEIMEQEDAEIFRILDSLADSTNNK